MPKKRRPNDPEAERLAKAAIPCTPSRLCVIGRELATGSYELQTVLCFAVSDEFETILSLDLAGVKFLAEQLAHCLKVMQKDADANDPLRN